jgi:hypothetical protein
VYFLFTVLRLFYRDFPFVTPLLESTGKMQILSFPGAAA